MYAVRNLLLDIVPDGEEAIKYRMPTIVYRGKNLIHYAGYKGHVGIYPLPETIEALKDELSGFKQGKGSIQFPNDSPLPLDVIRKIAKERLRQVKNA